MLKVVLITTGLTRVVEPLLDTEHCVVVGIIEARSRLNFDLPEKSLMFRCFRFAHNIVFGEKVNLVKKCYKEKIPYFLMTQDNFAEAVRWLKILSPDLILVYSMPFLLDATIFRLPPKGTINMHPSYLPDYRGPNPEFWQYYDTELNAGVTIHYVGEGEDTGDIIYQERTRMDLGTRSNEHLDLVIGKIGIKLMRWAIRDISRNQVTRSPQKITSTRRARRIRDEEHSAIIDWENWSVKRIWHLMRGTEGWLNVIPAPGGIMRGQRWRIGEYYLCDTNQSDIGKVVKRSEGYTLVAKDGVIKLKCSFNLRKFILRFL